MKYKMVLIAGPEWRRQADNQKGMNPFVDAVAQMIETTEKRSKSKLKMHLLNGDEVP